MSVSMLRTICDGLNVEPFSQNLTPVKLDSQIPEKLLQNLSNVIQWIQGLPFIDVRGENPDETAIRILEALRIFRYPPPRDIDQIQKWRLDILEGRKSTVFVILNWIFENIDHLKERVYLAKYLTRIEIPADAQSPEVAQLEALVAEKMEEFKLIHSQIADTRGDFLRAEDVRADLKSMEDEKEQLIRKIERNRRKLSRLPNLEKYLEIASRFHAETERQEELQLQCEEQKNALVHANQRLTRLQKALADAEHETNLIDPESIISKLKNEIEVSDHILNEKLASDISALKAENDTIQKILSMRHIEKSDITQLQIKVEELTSEISNIQSQQEQNATDGDDKLAIYRHQATNVRRKRDNVADMLQSLRQELDAVESTLSAKRKELEEKSGNEDIVTSVQYKAYMKKLRGKSSHYKRKKAEMDQANNEVQILERTTELLTQRIDELRKQYKEEGRSFIENVNSGPSKQSARPQTAKPTTTNVTELKRLIEQLNAKLSDKRSIIKRLSNDIDEFYQSHKDENDAFYSKQREADTIRAQMEENHKRLTNEISELEKAVSGRENELKLNKRNLEKSEWFLNKLNSTDDVETFLKELERENSECAKAVTELSKTLEELESDKNALQQQAMWRSLIKIFEMKINLHQQK